MIVTFFLVLFPSLGEILSQELSPTFVEPGNQLYQSGREFYHELNAFKSSLEQSLNDESRTIPCPSPFGSFPDPCDCQRFLICSNGKGFHAKCTIPSRRKAAEGFESYFDPETESCEPFQRCPQTGGQVRNETACQGFQSSINSLFQTTDETQVKGHLIDGTQVKDHIIEAERPSFVSSLCQAAFDLDKAFKRLEHGDNSESQNLNRNNFESENPEIEDFESEDSEPGNAEHENFDTKSLESKNFESENLKQKNMKQKNLKLRNETENESTIRIRNFNHESCSTYFQCSTDGKALLLHCPGNMYFDPSKRFCVFQDELTFGMCE